MRERGPLGLYDAPAALQHVAAVPLDAAAQGEPIAASADSVRTAGRGRAAGTPPTP